jgi:hypothetical protein
VQDDPGKILALSTAAGLAAPFAEHFFSGVTISADQLTYGSSVLAAAGMRIGLDCWLVVTPEPFVDVELTLKLPFAGATKLTACELISGMSYTVPINAAGSAVLAMRAAGTAVLHLMAENDSACEATKLWFPRGLAGAVAKHWPVKRGDASRPSPAGLKTDDAGTALEIAAPALRIIDNRASIAGGQHLPKYFSFYGYAPAEAQHMWSNLGTAPDLPHVIDAWNRYHQPAMLSVGACFPR